MQIYVEGSRCYLGATYNVSLHGGSQLVLVVGVEEPALPFSWQGAEDLVCGPEHSERLVDGHLEHREQPCILYNEQRVRMRWYQTTHGTINEHCKSHQMQQIHLKLLITAG